jgi:photosystem II stability/assembly factor-like uncharacterized protein
LKTSVNPFNRNRASASLMIIGGLAVFILALLSVSARSESVASAPDTWTKTNLHVGNIDTLAVAPSNPSVLYAGLSSNVGGYTGQNNSGMYKSVDGGTSWTSIGLAKKFIYALAVDPHNDAVVYAATNRDGIYKSTDGGAHWNGPYVISYDREIVALAIDPNSTNTLYASVPGNGLFKSTDGGINWTSISNGITYYTLNALVIDPGNPGVVYAAHGGGGVFKTTNGGDNWSNASTGISSASNTTALAIDPSHPSTLFVATSNYPSGNSLYKTDDGGAHWNLSNDGLPGGIITLIVVNPANSSEVFAGTTNGIFKSTDGGAHWSIAGLTGTSFTRMQINPNNPSIIYAGTKGIGVYRSVNGGATWSQVNDGFPFANVQQIVTDPNNPEVVYAGTNDGVFKSVDHGLNWSATGLNYTTLVPVTGLAIDRTNSSILYAGVDNAGVFKTVDGGATWMRTAINGSGSLGALGVDPGNPNNLFQVVNSFDLYKSTDGGGSWNAISNAPLNTQAIAVDPTSPNIVYSSGDPGVYKSTNGGTTWQPTGMKSSTNAALVIEPHSSSIIYAGTPQNFAFRTADGGTNWGPIFTQPNSPVFSIALDRNDPNVVYAGTAAGVFKSFDSGLTSTAFNAGLPSSATPINALAINSSDTYLYAGTPEGLYVNGLGANPTPSPTPANALSGRVTDVNGGPISDVTLTVSGAPGGDLVTTQTDVNGNYLFNNITGGDTLTPSKSGYIFSPSSVRSVSTGGINPIAGVYNFIGGTATYTLSGKVIDGTGAALSDTLINVSGSMQATVTTDASGNYSINGLFAGGSYSVRPSKTGYSFNPTSVGFSNLSTDKIVQTFVGTTHPYTINGQIKDGSGNPLSGINVTLSRAGGTETLTTVTSASGSYSFRNVAGEATYTVTPVKAGLTFNPQSFTYTNPSGTQVANFTATPQAAVLQFGATEYNVSEGANSASVIVTRSGDLSNASTVEYETSNGTAVERSDYTRTKGSLNFAAGEASKSFTVLITDNAFVDGKRTINLTLSNPSGGALGSPATALLNILDNDTAQPTTNPIDDAPLFVRQQYADFLNRAPDDGGLGYWSNEINKCGTDAQCIHDRRVGVADAFFFEPEFQQTGGYVYRIYKAALGLKPTYNQFISDRSRVVAGPGLDQSKTAYALYFVQSAAFQQEYATATTADQFVDRMLAVVKNYSGVDLSAQRGSLLGLYNGTDAGKAAILRQVADSQLLIDAEYNQSFVLMEYFGYLRRDPDQGGYDFWLGQVNKFPLRNVGIQHAMACSFITSAEYQTRFSSVVTHTNRECPQ